MSVLFHVVQAALHRITTKHTHYDFRQNTVQTELEKLQPNSKREIVAMTVNNFILHKVKHVGCLSN